MIDNVVHYKIHWANYNIEEATWEPVYNLGCNKLPEES